MNNYEEIYTGHHGFASHKWTHYLFIYDRLLAPWLQAGKPLTLLEIGVQNGGSLEIWKKYLPPGSRIHGIDINERCLRLSFSDGITFHHGSATDTEWINWIFADSYFDIILDDGSHYCPDVIVTFINLFKKLKLGGLYVVEDLHASYYPGQPYHGGLLRDGSSVEFFKLFIDTLHADYIDTNELAAVAGLTQFLPMYRQEIESVSFYDSFCAIQKFSQAKEKPFTQLTTGETFTVVVHDQSRQWQKNLYAIDTARALYADPSEAVPAPSPTADDLLVFGKDAFQAGNFSQATDIFSGLARQSPNNPLPPAYLAFIAAREDDVEKARTLMAGAMALAPDRAELPASLGEIFLTCGQAALAEEYLRLALDTQPELWTAYPALAQALRLLGRGDEALSILLLAAERSSPSQETMREMIVEMLAECGDLARHGRALRRYGENRGENHGASLRDLLAAARDFAHFDDSGEEVLALLGQVQETLASGGVAMDGGAVADISPEGPITIAFLCADFVREEQSARLLALLRRLPPDRFHTLLLNADAAASDYANHCAMLADASLAIATASDEAILEKVREFSADIVINLDGYAPTSRLALFQQMPVAYKLLWDDLPMPPLAPDCLALAGEALGLAGVMPTLALPGLGECHQLPDLAIGAQTVGAPVFICLASAAAVAEDAWQLFAAILQALPASSLLINLAGLGEAAQAFIGGIFTKAGVESSRLHFVQAQTVADWCALCNRASLGLAPLLGAGGPALVACLWMGRPYMAMASFLPWSRRPAALLEILGLEEWLAANPEAYLELARRPAPSPDLSLREKMIAAGINDEPAFALSFAAAIEAMLAGPDAGMAGAEEARP